MRRNPNAPAAKKPPPVWVCARRTYAEPSRQTVVARNADLSDAQPLATGDSNKARFTTEGLDGDCGPPNQGANGAADDADEGGYAAFSLKNGSRGSLNNYTDLLGKRVATYASASRVACVQSKLSEDKPRPRGKAPAPTPAPPPPPPPPPPKPVTVDKEVVTIDHGIHRCEEKKAPPPPPKRPQPTICQRCILRDSERSGLLVELTRTDREWRELTRSLVAQLDEARAHIATLEAALKGQTEERVQEKRLEQRLAEDEVANAAKLAAERAAKLTRAAEATAAKARASMGGGGGSTAMDSMNPGDDLLAPAFRKANDGSEASKRSSERAYEHGMGGGGGRGHDSLTASKSVSISDPDPLPYGSTATTAAPLLPRPKWRPPGPTTPPRLPPAPPHFVGGPAAEVMQQADDVHIAAAAAAIKSRPSYSGAPQYPPPPGGYDYSPRRMVEARHSPARPRGGGDHSEPPILFAWESPALETRKRPATRRVGTGATISERLEAVKAALAEEPKRVRSVEEMRGGSSSQDA